MMICKRYRQNVTIAISNLIRNGERAERDDFEFGVVIALLAKYQKRVIVAISLSAGTGVEFKCKNNGFNERKEGMK